MGIRTVCPLSTTYSIHYLEFATIWGRILYPHYKSGTNHQVFTISLSGYAQHHKSGMHNTTNWGEITKLWWKLVGISGTIVQYHPAHDRFRYRYTLQLRGPYWADLRLASPYWPTMIPTPKISAYTQGEWFSRFLDMLLVVLRCVLVMYRNRNR